MHNARSILNAIKEAHMCLQIGIEEDRKFYETEMDKVRLLFQQQDMAEMEDKRTLMAKVSSEMLFGIKKILQNHTKNLSPVGVNMINQVVRMPQILRLDTLGKGLTSYFFCSN